MTVGLGIIVVLFFLAFFIKNGGIFLHQKKLKSLLAAYIIILLASYGVIQILPPDNFLEVNAVSGETIVREQEASHSLFEAAMEGRPEQVAGIQIIKKWEFEFAGSQLTIDSDKNEYAHVTVFVKRKEMNDGKIEAFNYATRTIIQRIDVSDGIKPPILALEGTRLTLKEPEEYRLEIARFQREFLTNKILLARSQPEAPSDHFSNNVFGASMLYVLIPLDVEVISHGGIIMVD